MLSNRSLVLVIPFMLLQFGESFFVPDVQKRRVYHHDVRLHVAKIDDDDSSSKNSAAASSVTNNNAFFGQQADFIQKRIPTSWSDATIDFDTIATTAGGAILGAGLGIAASISNPDLASAVDPVAAGAAITGTAALAASVQQENEKVSKVTKTVLGGSTKSLGRFVVRQFQNVLGKMTNTIDRQIEQTKEDILALPERFVKFLRGKADEAVLEVQSIPQKLVEAANVAAEGMKKEMQRKAQETIEEVQMMPQKVADAAQMAAQAKVLEAKTTMEAAVEDVKAFPARKRDRLVAFFKRKPASKTTPNPPQSPPPSLS